MIVDTSDLHAFGTAQLSHADDLASVAAGLRAATVAADAFGALGAQFVAALNRALVQEAWHATQLAERLGAASAAARTAVDAYRSTEGSVARSISSMGG